MTDSLNQRSEVKREAALAIEETLVEDARGGLRPCQQVEQKLVSLLHGLPLDLGQLPANRPARPRS
jgi:hypothetical protein